VYAHKDEPKSRENSGRDDIFDCECFRVRQIPRPLRSSKKEIMMDHSAKKWDQDDVVGIFWTPFDVVARADIR
jgi:hypothetical protein